jgi:hypothetical protein
MLSYQKQQTMCGSNPLELLHDLGIRVTDIQQK